MAATFTQQTSLATGFGPTGAPLGLGLVRKFSLVLDGGSTAGTLNASSIPGCSGFCGVLSVFARTAGATAAVTSFSRTAITLTATANATLEILVHCQG